MTQLCVVKNLMRCNFMDRQVIENNFFNTLTQVVKLLGYLCLSWCTVILYYYTFSIIESPRHIVFFLCCFITLIITSVLPGITSHFYKNTVIYSKLDKKYLCLLLSVYIYFYICCNLVFCFCTDTFRLRGSRNSYEI